VSGSPEGIGVRNRRLAVRVSLVVVYILIGAAVFITGRTHTVLLDYKASEDGVVPALDQVTIYVGKGHEGIEYMGGEYRDQVLVRGQKQTIKVESFFGGEPVVRSFRIPVGSDMIVLSVPKAVAGVEPFLEPFVPTRVPLAEGGREGNESYTSPDSPGAIEYLEYSDTSVAP
jgi:hypothetical protein